MIVFVPFSPEHIGQINPQDAQLGDAIHAARADIQSDIANSDAWTGVTSEGPVGCAGIFVLADQPHRGFAWAYLGRNCGPYMIQIVRFMRDLIGSCDIPRIEATVATDFPEGHRLAKLLGFQVEAPRMLKWNPDGSDATLYARIR